MIYLYVGRWLSVVRNIIGNLAIARGSNKCGYKSMVGKDGESSASGLRRVWFGYISEVREDGEGLIIRGWKKLLGKAFGYILYSG